MSEEALELMEETGKWRAREVHYFKGSWERVFQQLPEFDLAPFRASPEAPENPFLKTVLRRPNTPLENPMPVGTVSHSYGLAPHREVAKRCLQGIVSAGIPADTLRFEAGLSQLGEWMNLRIYFPDSYSSTFTDGHPVGLRLECYNSVDGSSRLVLLLGWIRFICTNGLIIGETMVELRSIHNEGLDLKAIPQIVRNSLEAVTGDLARLRVWEQHQVEEGQIRPWVDKEVAKEWNKLAASRTLHICLTGRDGIWQDPFAKGKPSEKPMKSMDSVPGAPPKAQNLYDVSQALSWIASHRNNTEERLAWQKQIPSLVGKLQDV